MKPQDIWQPVGHYSAALNLPDGDIGEFDYQIGPYMRASNRDYWLNRKNSSPTRICNRDLPGYSLGYLFWVDWLGGAWEARGFDYFSAANAGHNSYTCPIMFVTDRADPASPLAWQTARAIWREFRRRSGRSDFRNRPLGHGELYDTTGVGTPTACPGPPILTQLHAGLGDLDFDEGDKMLNFPTKASRAYDSRPQFQGDVDLPYRDVNTTTGPLAAGQSRKIFVGLAQNAQVIVHATSANGNPTFAQISGTAEKPKSSLVNPPTSGDWRDCSVLTGITEGSVWVHAGPAPIDFIVEVQGTW